MGEVRGLMPGGGDRVQDAIPHLQEIIASDQPLGVVILWITPDPATPGRKRFFNSTLGEVLESDLAYFAAIMLARSTARPE